MNLIVTCSRHLEEEASDEISKILGELGDDNAKTGHSRFSGIVVVDTKIDPFQAVKDIKVKILDEPWSMRYCHRFIPIQESTKTTLEEIVDAVRKHLSVMNAHDTYRITVEKRGSGQSTKDMIDAIAKAIPNKVSLENYDWNIVVEILGDIAGISILKESDIVSTMKTKRDSSE
ncbi:MAG TPA: THUMP domain-containing protein [Candidatus Nitrosotalea sp.]|nr:THUMP domain-containing protein [Candidatus Nitrosotalea sp.]